MSPESQHEEDSPPSSPTSPIPKAVSEPAYSEPSSPATKKKTRFQLNFTPITSIYSSSSIPPSPPTDPPSPSTEFRRSKSYPSIPEAEDGAKTPSLAETYGELRRTLSLLQMGALPVEELGNHGKRMVWRRKGEGVKRPADWDQLVVHSVRGFLRSFFLGVSLNSAMDVFLILVTLIGRSKGPKRQGYYLQLFKLVALNSFRLGMTLGGFSCIYRLFSHGLRLLDSKEREKLWHHSVAGFAAGLAVFFERRDRRVAIGEQVLVRGFQGVFNSLDSQGRWRLPNGAVWLFGLSCGQIMYAWIVSNENLARGYSHWIARASNGPLPASKVVGDRMRYGKFEVDEVYASLNWPGITPKNKAILEDMIVKAKDGDYGHYTLNHALMHPASDSCVHANLDRFKSVAQWSFPVYASLHFIPPILLRRKAFLKDPMHFLWRSLKGSIRSSSFLGGFCAVYIGLYCSRIGVTQSDYFKNLPTIVQKFFTAKLYWWFCGFCTCFALFFEEKKRRAELAMYVIPKAMESAWSMARRKRYVPFVPGGEVILSSIGMSLIMSVYKMDPKQLSSLVVTTVYQLVGPT
ncbi:hypothetical protein BT69DRAFT_1330987 [Atractiella rhizophila]|nr:hypothetical protein BT69DRAFT_1330987 [Atractiella rhizophila]